MSQVHNVTYLPVHSLPLEILLLHLRFDTTRVGVAGRNKPAEEGSGKGAMRLKLGKTFIPHLNHAKRTTLGSL